VSREVRVFCLVSGAGTAGMVGVLWYCIDGGLVGALDLRLGSDGPPHPDR